MKIVTLFHEFSLFHPIIGSLIHNLDDAASDIHVPISLLLIQILDIIFQSMPKSHYISSSFWMPGRNFTTVEKNCLSAYTLRYLILRICYRKIGAQCETQDRVR